MTADDWKFQASFKFGRHQEAMLNVRANTPQELDDNCQAAYDVVGTLTLLADMLRAESLVGEHLDATRVDTPSNTARQGANTQAAVSTTPTCNHGNRVMKSGGQGANAWVGWFCPLDKSHPERCKPYYPAKA